MRRLLCSTVLAATLPAVALAQDKPTLLDLFSLDIIAQRMLQAGIMGLRTQMDLQYSGMAVDFRTGKITVTDFTAWPLPDWDDEGTCQIDIERITLRGAALDMPDKIRAKLQLSGLVMPTSCLPPDVREPFAMAGLTEIDMPRMTIDFDYGMPASDAVVRMHADIGGVGVVDISADFAYLWMDGRDDIEEPLPVMFLDHAVVSFTNGGIFEALKGELPPPLVGEGAGMFIEGGLGQEMIAANRDALDDPEAELSDSQSRFLTSLATAWGAFVAAPDTLVLETNIDGDVFVDLPLIEQNPMAMLDMFEPTVALMPAARSELLDVGLLAAALEGNVADLSEADKLRAGTALMTGVGAPRNISAGAEILEALAAEGDGEAAAVLAKALQYTAPEDAYRYALYAGREGESGMTALLDQLETIIPFTTILDLQSAVSSKDKHSGDSLGNVAEMRNEAAMRLSGLGQARSYEITALWSILGAATGDAESRDILADVEERVRLAGPEALKAWAVIEANASSLASKVWVDRDLPAQFNK